MKRIHEVGLLQLRGIDYCHIDTVYKEPMDNVYFFSIVPLHNIMRNMHFNFHNERQLII